MQSHNTKGVNPKLTYCPRCGDDAEELMLLGALDGKYECNTCNEEIAQHKAVVDAGGIYWKCEDCNNNGVIKKNDYSDAVREHMKIKAPDPCGIAFQKNEGCPICSDGLGKGETKLKG